VKRFIGCAGFKFSVLPFNSTFGFQTPAVSACGFGYTPVRSGAAEQRRMTAISGESTPGGHKAHPYITRMLIKRRGGVYPRPRNAGSAAAMRINGRPWSIHNGWA